MLCFADYNKEAFTHLFTDMIDKNQINKKLIDQAISIIECSIAFTKQTIA